MTDYAEIFADSTTTTVFLSLSALMLVLSVLVVMFWTERRPSVADMSDQTLAMPAGKSTRLLHGAVLPLLQPELLSSVGAVVPAKSLS